MPRELEGELVAQGLRFAVVVSRFNAFITEKLLAGAMEALLGHGADEKEVAIARVPGSLELAVAARKFALSGKYDAVIALGCVIRGATAHYDCVVRGTTDGLTRVAAETGVPVIFGVLTCDNLDQAVERTGTKVGNAGGSAALAAIEMGNLMKKLP